MTITASTAPSAETAAEAERPPAPKPEGKSEAEAKQDTKAVEAEHPVAPKPEAKSEVEAKQEIKAAEPAKPAETPAPAPKSEVEAKQEIKAIETEVKPAETPAAVPTPDMPVGPSDAETHEFLEAVVTPDEFHRIERHLAAHISHCLSGALVPGTDLNLKAQPREGKTDLRLELKGDMLEPNGALVSAEVMDMLKKHPQFETLFQRREKPFERQPDKHSDMVVIIFPQLNTVEYARLMHGLAKHADEKMDTVVPLHPQEAKQDTKAANDNPPTTTVSNMQHDEKLEAAPAKGAIRI